MAPLYTQIEYSDFQKYEGYGTLISQANGDSGDTAQREGIFIALSSMALIAKDYSGTPLKERLINRTLNKLEASPGVYRRGADPSEWYYKTDNFSRDQRAMLEIAMATVGAKDKLYESMMGLVKRFGFHQNTRKGTDDVANGWKIPDIVSPGEISTYIRGLTNGSKIGQILAYPYLCVLDLFTVGDLYSRKSRLYDADNMMAVQVLFNYLYTPTFVSRYVMKEYLKTDWLYRVGEYYSEKPDEFGNERNGIAPMPALFKQAYYLRTLF